MSECAVTSKPQLAQPWVLGPAQRAGARAYRIQTLCRCFWMTLQPEIMIAAYPYLPMLSLSIRPTSNKCNKGSFNPLWLEGSQVAQPVSKLAVIGGVQDQAVTELDNTLHPWRVQALAVANLCWLERGLP